MTKSLTSGIGLSAVEIRCWRAEWIKRLLRFRGSHIWKFDQVVVLEKSTRVFGLSKSPNIVALLQAVGTQRLEAVAAHHHAGPR